MVVSEGPRATARTKRSKLLVFFAVACGHMFIQSAATAAVGQPLIQWSVENPFRLFQDHADTALHSEVYRTLGEKERLRPILSAERYLAERLPRGWAEAVYRKTCWDDRKQRYGCAGQESYAHPKSHRVRAGLKNGQVIAGECRWSVTTISDPAREPHSIIAPCSHTVVFDVAYPAGATVIVRSAADIAQETIRVSDVFIVGLGDSVASGDGNPDRAIKLNDRTTLSYGGGPKANFSGYPARAGLWHLFGDADFQSQNAGWLSDACHRSLYGNQLRAALQLAIEDPHRAVTFASFACWGADTVNGIFRAVVSTPVVPNLPTESQLSAVARAQCGSRRVLTTRYARAFEMGGALTDLADLDISVCPEPSARKIDLLLASIGGNDVGFSELVANAALADDSPLRKLSSATGQLMSTRDARNRLAALGLRIKALNRAFHSILHIPWAQADRIVLIAYPPVAPVGNINDFCAGGRAGMTVMPDFSLDHARVQEGQRVGDELNVLSRSLSRKHGWTFVEEHRDWFIGHGICAGMRGGITSPSDDWRLPRFVDGAWRPFPPSAWQPYATRKRWFRTPNDAFLTVNFHDPNIGANPLNLLFASSYSGAFHPTAEGQAAIADAVLDKARTILKKYGAK